MNAKSFLGAAATCLAVLTGCSKEGVGDEPIAATSTAAEGTVAAAIGESDAHRKLAAALTDTRLAPVLDGKGEYTLLAPSDAAFMALGEKGAALSAKDRQPLTIAILRGHILPGRVTPEAVEAAIDRKQGRPVEMRTMAGGTVRFGKSDEGLTVSNGAQTAALAGTATTTSNGAVLSIDKVLLPAG